MPLAAVLDNLEGKPDYYKDIYVEIEGKWVLDGDVEGHPKAANLKSTLDKERKARRDAEKEKEKFSGVDLERWAKLKDLEEDDLAAFTTWREDKDKEGTKPELTDEEFNKRVERLTKKWETERAVILKENGDLKSVNETIRAQRKDDKKRTELLKACVGLVPGAVSDAVDLGMKEFDVNDDGELFVMGKDGNEILGADLKPMQPPEWLASKAQEKVHWWPRNSGGGAGGGNGNNGYGKVSKKSDLHGVEEQAQFVKKHGKDAYLNLPA